MLSTLVSVASDVRWNARSFARRHPAIYMPLIAFSRRPYDGSYRRISGATDILIDAYPRCANTFATFAFLSAQTGSVRVAHHFHAPAAVKAAARKGIPILTIIRHPKDAVASALIYSDSRNVKRGLEEYIDYYRCVQECRPKLFVARFEAVIHDFAHVTRCLNVRFGTTFGVFEATTQAVDRVNLEIRRANERVWKRRSTGEGRRNEQLTLPVSERESRKVEVARMILLPAHRTQLERAVVLYDELLRGADI